MLLRPPAADVCGTFLIVVVVVDPRALNYQRLVGTMNSLGGIIRDEESGMACVREDAHLPRRRNSVVDVSLARELCQPARPSLRTNTTTTTTSLFGDVCLYTRAMCTMTCNSKRKIIPRGNAPSSSARDSAPRGCNFTGARHSR